MGFPLSSPSGSAPRHRSDAPTTAFLPTFFITFFSYAHHRLAPQSVRRYLDSAPSRTAPVSRDERISGLKLFTCSLTTNARQMAPVSTPASARQTAKSNAKSHLLNTLHLTILLSST